VSETTSATAVLEAQYPPVLIDPEYTELGGTGMAAKYGLKQSGARPPLIEYSRQLWRRRHFITNYASSKNRALYAGAKLGQIWQLLTPILNVAVYFFVFGILLGTSRGVPDFILFLVIGVFLFNFMQTAMLAGSRSISDQLVLIRALHFPRASLPLAATVIQLQQFIFSIPIILIVALAKGEPITWKWLLIIPILALQFTFNAGLSMIVARMGSVLTDTSQLLPFILRTWMYMSGVLYSIYSVTKAHKGLPKVVLVGLQYNPPALYINAVRNCLIHVHKPAMAVNETITTYKAALVTYQGQLDAMRQAHYAVPAMIIWALLLGFGGFIYFWKAEEQYGRG
jgi:teichoic acid transport system permease protein